MVGQRATLGLAILGLTMGSGDSVHPHTGYAPDQPVRPPVALLVAAGTAVVLAAALIPLTLLSTHVIGYVLASFVTITLVALYRSTAQRRRRNPYYSPRPELRRLGGIILLAGVVVAAAHVWVIATHLAS